MAKRLSRPVRLALVVASLVGGALAIYQLINHVRASSVYRAAQKALDGCEFRKAATLLERYCEARPRDGEALLLAGQTARRMGDFGRAEKRLKLALENGAPTEAVGVERLLLRVQSGSFRSPQELIALCQSNPSGAEAGILLEAIIQGSFRRADLDRTDWAIDLWLKHRTTPIDQARGQIWRGQLEAHAGNFLQAMECYRKAVSASPDYVPARIQVVNLLVRDDPQAAPEEMAWLLRHAPQDVAVRHSLARWRRSLGYPEEAGRLLDELLAEDPESVSALVDRARVSLDLRRPEEAERFLRRALLLAPRNREIHSGLADCTRMAGRLEESEHHLAHARGLQSDLEEIPATTRKSPPFESR